MSLYGRTDSNANKTQAGLARGNGSGSVSETIVFIDAAEAVLNENASRGITGPGWWAYKTYTDGAGNTRHKAECLAFISKPDGSESLSDDTIGADVASAVTITAQPAASTSSSEAGTFTLTTTTTGTPGALAYQWQRQTAAATTRWVNIAADTDTGITYADFTTATLAYSSYGDDSLDGYKYRVKITSAGGTEEVISDGAATLTYGD
ncbi:head protein [Synechococcus phage S-MbCM6]|uniref:Virion structural protein n=1 Tax=Synechococcus phage S-MbCM6 TaxID=3126011 RepID=H8ZMT1_9CAUD|nr:head protein [Synechococcus phage ACG-2014c]AFD02792.1 virion structural protein [Synechococcus phage ACG-2014c]